MKNLNLENVQEITDFARPTAGGHICIIKDAKDFDNREYLKIEYDFADGELKDYYLNLSSRTGFWGGSFIKSYREKALPFFKGFITAVEQSNNNYKFDSDESKLVGKMVGLVLGEEEYKGNDGTVKTRLYVDSVRSIKAIKNSDFKVPEKKCLETVEKVTDGFTKIDDDEIFF